VRDGEDPDKDDDQRSHVVTPQPANGAVYSLSTRCSQLSVQSTPLMALMTWI
jgi:hypothetical protein